MASTVPAQEAKGTVQDTAVTDATTDGKDLFNGLYFGLGEVGRKLIDSDSFIGDPHGRLEKNREAESREAIAKIVASLDEKHPPFFADFSDQLRSGDPRKVEQAIVDGAEKLKEYAEEEDDAYVSRNGALCVANAAIAVNLVAVLNVATYAAAIANVEIWVEDGGGSGQAGAPLNRDEQIAKFTKLLRTI